MKTRLAALPIAADSRTLASATTASPGAMGIEIRLNLVFGYALSGEQSVEVLTQDLNQFQTKIRRDPIRIL